MKGRGGSNAGEDERKKGGRREKDRRAAYGSTLYLQHESVLNVEHDLLLLSVVSYEGVDGVTVGHPADEARVGGEGDDRVAFNAVRVEVTEGGRAEG